MTFTQAMDAGVLDYLTHPPTHTREVGDVPVYIGEPTGQMPSILFLWQQSHLDKFISLKTERESPCRS